MTAVAEAALASSVQLACAGTCRQLQEARRINPAFRFARREDIGLIADMRCAQSLEYWGVDPSFDAGVFRQVTEAYLERNLGTRILFGIIEDRAETASVSGLEMNDRLPTLGSAGGACGAGERSATIVSCYTPDAHRGRGYMGQMLDIWMSLATLLNVDALYLESHNPSMQRMAERDGYRLVSNKYKLSLEGGAAYGETIGTSARIGLDERRETAAAHRHG